MYWFGTNQGGIGLGAKLGSSLLVNFFRWVEDENRLSSVALKDRSSPSFNFVVIPIRDAWSKWLSGVREEFEHKLDYFNHPNKNSETIEWWLDGKNLELFKRDLSDGCFNYRNQQANIKLDFTKPSTIVGLNAIRYLMCQPNGGFIKLNWMFRGHASIKLWNNGGDILFPELGDTAISIGHYTKNKSIYYIELESLCEEKFWDWLSQMDNKFEGYFELLKEYLQTEKDHLTIMNKTPKHYWFKVKQCVDYLNDNYKKIYNGEREMWKNIYGVDILKDEVSDSFEYKCLPLSVWENKGLNNLDKTKSKESLQELFTEQDEIEKIRNNNENYLNKRLLI
tara:strand:+ start:87 stop:1097 length:1011 start_codon:yes stop_codon:yes gene_type:complete